MKTQRRSMTDMNTLRTGAMGLAAIAGGLTPSLSSHVIPWLQVASMLTGLVVGALTIKKLLKD